MSYYNVTWQRPNGETRYGVASEDRLAEYILRLVTKHGSVVTRIEKRG